MWGSSKDVVGYMGLDTDAIVDASETVQKKQVKERRIETGSEAQEERHSKRGVKAGSDVNYLSLLRRDRTSDARHEGSYSRHRRYHNWDRYMDQ